MSAASKENASSSTAVSGLLNWKGLEKTCRTYFSAMEASVSEYENTVYVIPSHLLEVLDKYCGGYHPTISPTFWRAVTTRNYNSHHIDTVRNLIPMFHNFNFQLAYPVGESRLLQMLKKLEEALPMALREPDGYISRIINATHKYLLKHMDKLTNAERALLMNQQPEVSNDDNSHLKVD